ncbi:hypothetical protein O6H91_06G015200 [Diphasiastrum complanatum]|nr:hypothetical protein O6H91_06G015200 [Diphasiastrum complanatum]KAJ7551431.1 hypothetical protein O6H91_06G015200 [Diphasiastrum complanatum]KAJ7551433.1 hypothetical protein O6H91_06G015200 [Diphasiastrum complanatum]
MPTKGKGKDMNKASQIVGTIVLVICLSSLFQWPIFYGLIKLSIFSCNAISNLTYPSPSTKLERTPSSPAVQPEVTPSKDGFIESADNKTEMSFHEQEDSIILLESRADSSKPKQQALHAHGYAHYPFVQFSAYRDSERTFFLIGITSVVARGFDQPVQWCEWQPLNNGSQQSAPTVATKAHMIYVYYDQLPRLYVVAMVNCTFEEEVGIKNEGGLLFITVSVGPHLGDTERKLALEEKKGTASDLIRKRNNPPSLKIAFCGPPLHGNIRADWILQWLMYYHYLWKEKAHFFFYNVGGLGDSHRRVLDPFLKGGYLTIIDAVDQNIFPSWYHNQLLFINDCLHMTRYLSSWTFFHDMDEFLFVPRPRTLDKLLDRHKEKTFITFGSIPSATSLCADPPLKRSHWLVQRFLWMQKRPHCLSDQDPWVCLQGPGARKYVVNPRKIIAAAVHNTALPSEGGINLNATMARMYHYHGALSGDAKLCEKKVNVSLPRDQLEQEFPEVQQYNTDLSISKAVDKARKYCALFLKTL